MDERERIARNLSHAFPVPDAGSFSDLLNAIDNVEQRFRT